jgi:8-oxo-dGTP pyrophosphatase MutT (NUDIX family)
MSGQAVLPGWLGPLAAALQQPDRLAGVVRLRPGRGGRPAAVLVLVGQGPAGPEVVLVERAATLRNHPSQIAFPGGAADPGDADLVATALREAEEEIGVPASAVQVLGLLPAAHVAVSGFDVTAVVGWWRDPGGAEAVDAQEVAAVHVVPVDVLTDPALRASVRHPSGYTGPAFQVGEHLVWGLTAHLLDGVLELAGWQRAWDATRTVPIPARYLVDRAARPGPDPSRPEAPLDEGGPDAH